MNLLSTMDKLIFSTYFVLILYLLKAQGDLLSFNPEYVPEMEKSMANTIRDHLGDNPDTFASLVRLIGQLEKRSEEHSGNEKIDVLSTFRMVNSLVDEWKEISKTILQKSSSIKNDSKKQLPKSKDIEDVVLSLFRIQDTYRFNTKDVASGTIAGLNSTGALTGKECYDIGMVAYGKSDFYHALSWLQEAGTRLEDEAIPTVSDIEVLAPMAIALERTNNHKHAVRAAVWLSDLLDGGAGEKIEIIKKYPEIENLMRIDGIDRASLFGEQIPQPINERNVKNPVLKGSFEAPCRGNDSKQVHIDPNAKCHFETGRPFLKLAPAKVEILNIKPLVLIYRNVISDNEIRILKKLVKGQLKRSKVGGAIDATGSYVSEERTSSTAWILKGQHPVADALRKRAGTVTGLNMETAESLQMCSYGIGGHFISHHDHATEIFRKQKCTYMKTNLYEELHGERIATLMYYLTVPEFGGATVFPYLQLTIMPSQSDAVFWYNLKKSGEGIHDTLHGGCPVISGVKWVANQWIMERGQEFLRKCGLKEDE